MKRLFLNLETEGFSSKNSIFPPKDSVLFSSLKAHKLPRKYKSTVQKSFVLRLTQKKNENNERKSFVYHLREYYGKYPLQGTRVESRDRKTCALQTT